MGVLYIKIFLNILLYALLGVVGIFLLAILFVTVVALTIPPKKQYDRESPFYRGVLNVYTAVALWVLRVRVRINGADKLPEGTNFLFISNHRSNYDPIVQWYALRKYRISFVSKSANFRIPWFGRIIRKCCFMEIDRKSPKKSMETVNRAAKLLRETENCVGIYPEGTRSKSCKLLPFHSGVLKIAQKAEKPLVIAVVTGTESIAKNLLRFRRSLVVIDIIETMEAQLVKNMRSSELGEYARSLMERKLEGEENEYICSV